VVRQEFHRKGGVKRGGGRRFTGKNGAEGVFSSYTPKKRREIESSVKGERGRIAKKKKRTVEFPIDCRRKNQKPKVKSGPKMLEGF